MELAEISGKITELLHVGSNELSLWLEKHLAQLDQDWWRLYVLPSLSYQQGQRVERSGITHLSKLDLSALLLILDKNWYQLSQLCKFEYQDRNYIKEMQTVRNRWAHIDTAGIDNDDVYRDLDTLQRVLALIDTSTENLAKVNQLKKQILVKVTSRHSPKPERKEKLLEEKQVSSPSDITIKSMVTLKSDHSKQGPVLEMEGNDPSSRCQVFIDGQIKPFYLSQLELVIQEEARRTVSLPELHCLLTSLQINHPSLSTLYSLNAARIDFVPYQFRPALKIIRSDRPRLLIADGVGVGKTIEAGLILRELQARSDIKSVLIICPKPLVAEQKWKMEMKRFDEEFTQLDGKGLQACLGEMDLDGEWPDRHKKTIIPYSLFDEKLIYGKQKGRKKQMGLLALDPPPQFDLVIVDEAHHIRNASTFTHQGVRFFCDNAEAIIFLTATPIQMGNQDLFTLLNVLRPDLVIDSETFEHMAEPNPYINAALGQARAGADEWQKETVEFLNNAAQTSWGQTILKSKPSFQNTRKLLLEEKLDREQRISIIREIERFHSFAHIINRTRRRDIGEFCIRRTKTIEIPFTEAQQELHDELLRFESIALAKLHGNQNVGFMMSTIRRQAASCIFGLSPFISDILNRRLSDLEMSETIDGELILDEEFEILMDAAIAIEGKATNLPSNDPKFQALHKIISDKQHLENNKLMVFSSFRHTLAYLKRKLRKAAVRVEVVHGGVEDLERLAIRKRFELPKADDKAVDVVLFSEVGCEGLDYQFCDGMINYDLPWNPMRIEQRIGRIDRRGQKSEYVTIYNFITPSTIDADIYTRCLKRIGIFEASIGDCEEILGDIHRKIKTIADNTGLTADERQAKLEQLADNEVNEIQEQRKLEDREHELFGIQVPKNQIDNDVRNSESFWLSSLAIQRFVQNYLESCVGPGEYILGESSRKTMRLSQDARNLVLADFRKLPNKRAPVWRSWEKWLKGAEQHCSVTFDSKCAADQRDIFFIMPLHPLVLQAASFLESPDPVYTAMKVIDVDSPAGTHLFAVYAWEYKGFRPEIKLVPICADEVIYENFFDYTESAVTLNTDLIPNDPDFEQLDTYHYESWVRAKEAHQKKTLEICAYRRESLETSHIARLNILEDQISSATNEKIKRMRQAQKDNIQADYDREVAMLVKAEAGADIHARPVVFGVLKVENNNGK